MVNIDCDMLLRIHTLENLAALVRDVVLVGQPVECYDRADPKVTNLRM